MNLLITACLLSQLMANGLGNPRNVDVPLMTMGLETQDGVEITLRYPATYWGPDPVVEASQLEDLVTPRLAVLKTNTQIRIGEARIDPGAYFLGFETLDDETWRMVISTEEQEWVNLFIPMQLEENYVPFLSFVFTPGITDRDFLVNGLFGHFSCTMRWVISGVPSEIVDLNGSAIDVNALMRAPQGIAPATGVHADDAEDRPRSSGPRAGSGVFRHYLENQSKE